jgi:hypothetical protein
MKKLMVLIIIIYSSFYCFSQTTKGEKVKWDSLEAFHTNQIIFKSEKIKMVCKNCNFIEIKSKSGINGIFLLGEGTVEIKEENISDNISGCLIRFNPEDMDNFITIEEKTKFENKAFMAISMNIIKVSFRHCYHAGSNALIPEKGNYALNMFSETYGEILASYSEDKKVLYNFTERKEMFK